MSKPQSFTLSDRIENRPPVFPDDFAIDIDNLPRLKRSSPLLFPFDQKTMIVVIGDKTYLLRLFRPGRFQIPASRFISNFVFFIFPQWQ